MSKLDKKPLLGVIYAVLAFVVWGMLPLYWKLVKDIPADESLSIRAICFFITIYAILIYKKQLKKVKESFSNLKTTLLAIVAAIMVATNWFVFVLAVNSDNIVQVSLGYYMTPLVSVFLGRMVLKEKLNSWQKVSLILAIIGVSILTFSYGKIPWISLCLAIAFALYGLVKKIIKVDSLVGLGMETIIIIPIAILYIVLKGTQSAETIVVLTHSKAWILVFSGIVTAVPLLLFSAGAKRVQLSTLGFLQYIYPTLSLLIGVLVYNEPFTKIHGYSFGFIWIGLFIYSLSQTKLMKKI